MNKEELSILIRRLFDENWEVALDAADILSEHPNKKVVNALIKVLDSDLASARNAASLALREIRDDTAVNPLLCAIKKAANRDNRATMVYALEKHDCSGHFKDIFQIALSEKGDVRLAALNILGEQGFFLDDQDIKWAEELLEDNKARINDEEFYAILNGILSDFKDSEF